MNQLMKSSLTLRALCMVLFLMTTVSICALNPSTRKTMVFPLEDQSDYLRGYFSAVDLKKQPMKSSLLSDQIFATLTSLQFEYFGVPSWETTRFEKVYLNRLFFDSKSQVPHVFTSFHGQNNHPPVVGAQNYMPHCTVSFQVHPNAIIDSQLTFSKASLLQFVTNIVQRGDTELQDSETRDYLNLLADCISRVSDNDEKQNQLHEFALLANNTYSFTSFVSGTNSGSRGLIETVTFAKGVELIQIVPIELSTMEITRMSLSMANIPDDQWMLQMREVRIVKVSESTTVPTIDEWSGKTGTVVRKRNNTFQITDFAIVDGNVYPETTLAVSDDQIVVSDAIKAQVKERSISKQGFHRVLNTIIEFERDSTASSEQVSVSIGEVFPESVFLDQYELDELCRVNQRKQSQGEKYDPYFETKIGNSMGVDVEKPATVSPIVYSMFTTNSTWTRKGNSNIEVLVAQFQVPIHFRYQTPSIDQEFATVTIHAPITFSVGGSVVRLGNTCPILEIQVPRGQLQHSDRVKIGTVVVTVCGSLAVLIVTMLTVWRSSSKMDKEKKE